MDNEFEIPSEHSKYIVDNNILIAGFFGENRFLSNFYPAETMYQGVIYPNSECAYQASKVMPEDREKFTKCTAAESKKLWKECRNYWGSPIYAAKVFDAHKYNIMKYIVLDKFTRNAHLKEKLLNTGNKCLVELNWWGDIYYGFDITQNKGENKLGEILMKVRDFIR